ncbi:hypothetical protein C488_13543 [Natrinema pellirubrum DSM 15624]|uniref:Uncharacterized protein n=2 Tax=Natrinema TaxID=88723 RepID=L0JKY0_NATP1|nr:MULTISPECIES: hypothetical protein [Natrinema]AGB31498.1 hypothetical protein Natpe_1601 [Natrinema pellirubrum DSM 15624]ELY73827.1 hypothetical protein C488_13543 [Natrinema pellirubrum DSM 15624]ELZ09706.1 hypothetical protein C478_16042 [Natrinema thermotolerans DSM 11552]WMT07356.1 hypothetical protein NP511_18455 [Natrinema thermotolerans]
MVYQLRCDGCDFEREHADWADANRDARDHEAEHGDHWVRIVDLQEA